MINARYEIIKKLGEGRSSVFLCRDMEFPEKEYAIKILPPNKDEFEKNYFIKEYFTLQNLEHSGIIKSFETGTVLRTDGESGIQTSSLFLTMEYFDGEELLSSKRVNNENILREIVKQICSALYYLHLSKYIYYDLKPENILVTFKENKPQIKLIDLGFAEYSPSVKSYEIKGTSHYIAPELLKKEFHTHSVDLYSLGVILYRIIYNRFPFDSENELDIYKAAIEDEIDFPASEYYSPEFINVVRKLLERNTSQRYSSALTVIKDLGFELDISITKEFFPARVFAARENVTNILLKYISDKSNNEVYAIKGFEGVGKSSLLHKLFELNTNVVMVADVRSKTTDEILRFLLRQIIFSPSVYLSLDESERDSLLNQLRTTDKEILDKFRQMVAALTLKCKFVLLIDDFNLYDQLTRDMLADIIPLLQVNHIHIVVAESSENIFLSERLNNVKEITLSPFTKDELKIFLKESYNENYPTDELEALITTNADLVPGNIKSFIKDLILFDIIKFAPEKITFSDETEKLKSITEAHSKTYDLRLANLSEMESYAAHVLSALEIYIDGSLLSNVLDLKTSVTEEIISNLQLNNIIQKFSSGQTLIFTSEAVKKYIYNSIRDKKELHFNLAKKISSKISLFNRLELARQYELAGIYQQCFMFSMEEVSEAEKHSAFTYILRILYHLSKLPLESKQLDLVKIKLSEVYFRVGDFQSSLRMINELKSLVVQNRLDKKLYNIEGSVLIASGEYESGKKVITELLENVGDETEKPGLELELAYADFELKNYDGAIKQCEHLLQQKNISAEIKGRCYNLKGMIDIYKWNDLESALNNFQYARKSFSDAGQPVRIAGVEVNIGNIYNILKIHDKAEEHWNNASKINQSIGNLEQEGLLLQNVGIFYYNQQKFQLAIESYLKAQNIFLSLGKEDSSRLIQINLSEVYLRLCEYLNSLNYALDAYKFFSLSNNFEETFESLSLLAKNYYFLGNAAKLVTTLAQLEEILRIKELPSRYQTNYKYLSFLPQLLKGEIVSSEELSLVVDEYKLLEEMNFVFETRLLLISNLIKQEKFKDAYNQLMDNQLIDFCRQNSILEAEREYFLGLISKSKSFNNLSSPLEYFERAYELIKDEFITELTWKVMYEISELYIERGNVVKAKRFVVYAREIIYFMAEKLEKPQLRASYLRSPERFETLKKLESFYPG